MLGRGGETREFAYSGQSEGCNEGSMQKLYQEGKEGNAEVLGFSQGF